MSLDREVQNSMHRSSHLLVEAREAYVHSCFSSRWCQREALCSSPSSATFWARRGAGFKGFREKVTPFAPFSSRLIRSSFPAEGVMTRQQRERCWHLQLLPPRRLSSDWVVKYIRKNNLYLFILVFLGDSKVWRQHRWGTGGGPDTHIWWEKKTSHPAPRGCKHGALTLCLRLSCDRKEALYVGLFCSAVKSYCNSGCVEKEQFRDRWFFLLYFSRRWLSHRSLLTDEGRNHFGRK